MLVTNPDFYSQFIKHTKPVTSKSENQSESFGYRLSFIEQCFFDIFERQNEYYFKYGLDLKGEPTIDSIIRDYINLVNTNFDKKFELQTQNYIIASSSGNYKKEDLKKIKPDTPNYLTWNTPKWIEFLEENDLAWIFE